MKLINDWDQTPRAQPLFMSAWHCPFWKADRAGSSKEWRPDQPGRSLPQPEIGSPVIRATARRYSACAMLDRDLVFLQIIEELHIQQLILELAFEALAPAP